MNLNIMMDPVPLYPRLFHPLVNSRTMDYKGDAKHYSRTWKPTKYFLIDFGLSRKYNPDDGPPLEFPILGGDKTVPEFQHSDEAVNPFPTDIYYLGNLIREDFLQVTVVAITVYCVLILREDGQRCRVYGTSDSGHGPG